MYRVDHFAYEVRDMDAALAFYQGLLGLRLLSRDRDEAHGEEFAFLELNGGNLELLQRLPPPTTPVTTDPARRAYAPHLALVSDDLPATVATLRAKGVQFVKGPLEIPGKVTWAYAADPDGNVVEFIQWLSS